MCPEPQMWGAHHLILDKKKKLYAHTYTDSHIHTPCMNESNLRTKSSQPPLFNVKGYLNWQHA